MSNESTAKADLLFTCNEKAIEHYCDVFGMPNCKTTAEYEHFIFQIFRDRSDGPEIGQQGRRARGASTLSEVLGLLTPGTKSQVDAFLLGNLDEGVRFDLRQPIAKQQCPDQ